MTDDAKEGLASFNERKPQDRAEAAPLPSTTPPAARFKLAAAPPATPARPPACRAASAPCPAQRTKLPSRRRRPVSCSMKFIASIPGNRKRLDPALHQVREVTLHRPG
jgi:hypothetical protein